MLVNHLIHLRFFLASSLTAWLFFLPIPASATDLILDPHCTLIDAIQAANTDSAVNACPAGSGADRIVLSDDVVLEAPLLERNGPTGLPVITSTIRIDGNGHTIRRAENAPRFRLFYIDAGDLTLEDLTLANGSLDGIDGAPGEDGVDGAPGGPGVDGDNATAGSPGEFGEPGGDGAGIYLTDGELTLQRVRLTGHSARGGDGARGGNGGRGGDGEQAGNGGDGGRGGRGGYGGRGAGIFNLGGDMQIIDSVLDHNSVTGGRGGRGGNGGNGGDSRRDPPGDPYYGYGGGGGLPGRGGVGGVGAAIYNAAPETAAGARLQRSEVSHNDASGGTSSDNSATEAGQPGLRAALQTGGFGVIYLPTGASGGDGAIFNAGSLTVMDTHFGNNRSAGADGAARFLAPGQGPTSITMAAETGGRGGVSTIRQSTGSLTLSGASFVENRADGGTGGPADGSGGAGGATIGNPGYCLLTCPDGPGSLHITNSTFSGNTADGGTGTNTGQGGTGGMAVLGSSHLASMIFHVSVVNNSAQGGAGGTEDGEPGFVLHPCVDHCQGEISVANSLFAGNSGHLCGSGIALLDGNLADTGDCPGIPNGLTGVDPVLADHGGPTPTHALLPHSSARDAADPTLCDETGGVDQRGWERDPSITGACDLGAFEYNPVRLFGHGFE